MNGNTRNSIRIGRTSRQLHRGDEFTAAAPPPGTVAGTLARTVTRHGPVGNSPPGIGPLCVLVVDDDAAAAEGLSTMVKTWGHKVLVAGDGTAALEMATAFRADVVLLDIVMPKVDGCQVARRLRRQANFEDTLLIALLDGADGQHRARAESAGVDVCLVKPVESATLQVLLMLEQDWLAQEPRPFVLFVPDGRC